MTPFDWLWDWRTLIALAVGDGVLLVMFLAWDAKHLAFLMLRTREPGHMRQPGHMHQPGHISRADRGALPPASPGSGT